MHIEESIKLDFKDVLIRPKRSTLLSRLKVDISREFVFLNSQRKYQGIPIIAANMDTTGTMEMANEMARHGLSTALHKYYGDDELAEYFLNLKACGGAPSSAFYSMGIGKTDYDKFQ